MALTFARKLPQGNLDISSVGQLYRRHQRSLGSAGQRSARMLRKASRMPAAVEKRSALAGAHALIRNAARSGWRSGRIVLGSITGSPVMGMALGYGWWPLHRS